MTLLPVSELAAWEARLDVVVAACWARLVPVSRADAAAALAWSIIPAEEEGFTGQPLRKGQSRREDVNGPGVEGKEAGRSSREVCKGRELDVLHSHMICLLSVRSFTR